MFVIKSDGKYLRFASYSAISLMDRPEQATLYNVLKTAKTKLKGTYYHNSKIWNKPLEVKKIIFNFIEEDV